MVRLFIQGIQITALVDTGASCTLLRLDTFHRISERTHRTLFVSPACPLQGVNGTPLDVVGQTEIRIGRIASPMKVTIAKTLGQEFILGADALHRGQGVVDMKDNQLIWYGYRWPLCRGGMSGQASIGPITPQTGHTRFDLLIRKNASVFSAKGEANGQCKKLPPLTINTDSPPISQRAYRAPLSKRRLIEEAIEEMLAEGVIRPSSSPWASPVTLVPKKDGSNFLFIANS